MSSVRLRFGKGEIGTFYLPYVSVTFIIARNHFTK